MNTHISLRSLLLALPLALLCGCGFDIGDESEQLTLSLLYGDNTREALPQIRAVFSLPVIDSSVSFTINPPVPFIAHPRNASDTFEIQFSQFLTPKTDYTVCATESVRSTSGLLSTTNNRCETFTTPDYTLEQEPNNSAALADTFTDLVFGTFWSSGDTDFFSITIPDSSALVLTAVDQVVGLSIFDTAGTVLSNQFPLLAGVLTSPPFPPRKKIVIKLFALSRSTGSGFYRLERQSL